MTAAPLDPTRRAVLASGAMLVGTGALSGRIARDPVVACRVGRFVGTRNGGIATFRGIRYGEADRFRAPSPITVSRETMRATEPGPACPQRSKRSPQSEECLTLNIWSPETRPGARRPVMVWVHGGGYAFGSANDDITDGRLLAAAGDVVVVSVNHRLNALGYLYLAGLSPAFPDSGNAGQLDLVLALMWVRDNIAAFGGDPACVTLFGQSGGGAKIATLLAMPGAHGLFHRAITMSGQQVTVSSPDHATRRARSYLARLGTSDPLALREQPVQKLIDALDADDPIERSTLYTGPVLDGRIVQRHPFSPDADPAGRDVAMMLGGTHDEMRAFSDPASPAMRGLTWATLPEKIAAELPVRIAPQSVIAAYRKHWPTAAPGDIFYAATTDGRSWRPQVIEAEALARAGRPAHVYQVDFPSPTKPERRAFHGIDIGLVFGTLDAPDAWTGNGADACALSRTMQQRFIAFARTGRPDLPGAAPWPHYDLQRRATMVFDAQTRVVDDPRAWQRTLFAPAPYVQPGS